MKKLYLLALVCFAGIAAYAQTTVSRTTSIYAGTSPFQDSMWTFKSTDYSVVRRMAPSMSGFTITGVNGIATDPTSGEHYAIVKASGVTGRLLVKMNVQTGVCTNIGNLHANFSTLAFNENGTLWGVTGDGANPSEVMFWINKSTADTTRFRALGAGADGEVITFCPDNHKFYHWSGNGTVVWERFDTTGTDVIESLTYSGAPGGETFGGIYIGGGQFLMSNIASQFKMWDTSGNIGSALSSNPDDIRGLVMETYTTSISASATTVCAGTNVTFNVTGGTGNYQWYLDGSAISGATNDTYVATTSGVYNATYADGNGITDSVATGIMLIVNPLPAMIAGSDRVCVSSMITLTDATPGGTWSSSGTSTATVGSSDGMVMGVAAGTTNITYTLPTGCYVSMPVSVTALPVVSGGSSVAICYGNSTSMTASGADVYSWSPADGLSCTNCSNPTASPTVTTTYTVTGTTRQAITYSEAFTNGTTPTTQCTSWDAFRATLNGSYNYTGFTMRGSMNPVGISCTDPAIATAVANAMRAGTSYSGSSDGQTWYVDIGCTSGSCGPTAVALQNFPGCSCVTGYSVRPAIGNANWGCIDGYTCTAPSQTMEVVFYIEGCTSTSSVTVSVNPLPMVYNVIGGGSYCEGGAGREIMLDSSNGGIRYQLYEGLTLSGSTVDGIEDTITFGMRTTAGTYTIEGTDTATGCINWMAGSVNITITPTVTPTVAIWQSTVDTVCQGTAITFATSITNGGSNPHYMWKVNGSSAGTDSVGFGHTPGVGTSKVSVILVSNAICAIPDTVMSDTLTTIIWPNGTPTITLDASPNDTVCEGTVVTVNPTVTFAGYTPSYIWVKNAILVSTSSSYTYTPIDGDDIYAVMTSNYMCRDTDDAYSNVVNMTVVDPVVPSVTITGAPGMVLTPGHADTLYATVVNGGTNPSYQWYLNGTLQAGATSNMFIRSGFADGDSVTVRVTRNDACGLYTVNSVKLRVYKVGVQTLAGGSNISLVPNPNNGTFSVTGSLGLVADEEVTAEVVNMIGQVVYTGKFMTQNGNVDAQVQTNNLANGQYMLNLHSSAGNGVVRFVIER